ncbi:MAG: hypothetical protein IKG58_04110 [Bacilli bacterium]|nr:hypothetical protein [Bacilli bacterium]MBR3049720.1 hypothetical protein [Bacilli bacterium]
MNKAMLTVGIIILSAIALLMINIVSNYSTGSELDYYLLKETAESSMNDAVDTSFYRKTCMLRIDREKFIESFLCRFADTVDNTREYVVAFYDISEVPPKASVKIDSQTVLRVKGEGQAITTTVDAILEENYHYDQYCENKIKEEFKK